MKLSNKQKEIITASLGEFQNSCEGYYTDQIESDRLDVFKALSMVSPWSVDPARDSTLERSLLKI